MLRFAPRERKNLFFKWACWNYLRQGLYVFVAWVCNQDCIQTINYGKGSSRDFFGILSMKYLLLIRQINLFVKFSLYCCMLTWIPLSSLLMLEHGKFSLHTFSALWNRCESKFEEFWRSEFSDTDPVRLDWTNSWLHLLSVDIFHLNFNMFVLWCDINCGKHLGQLVKYCTVLLRVGPTHYPTPHMISVINSEQKPQLSALYIGGEVFTWRLVNVRHSEALNVEPVKKSHIESVIEGVLPLNITITESDRLFLADKRYFTVK